ncbi:hypothetical protein [Neisseria sp.]
MARFIIAPFDLTGWVVQIFTILRPKHDFASAAEKQTAHRPKPLMPSET